MVIGPGKVNLTLRCVWLRRKAASSTKTGPRRATAPDHHRHVGIVAIADPDGLLVLEIDAVEILDERRDEMAARLLAVADDVDAGLLLIADGEANCVALALGELRTFEQPRRPELIGRREPRRLGQASGDRRRQ